MHEYRREFASYTALEEFLRKWTTWRGEPHVYDTIGILGLLGASLENIGRNGVSADELNGALDEQQKAVLLRLAAMTTPSSE